MCACGCLVLAGIVAALVYTIMHGLWLLTAVVLLIAAVLGWLARRMFKERKSV
jgi:threonine/homoserine/homoserine lactone efflux protein